MVEPFNLQLQQGLQLHQDKEAISKSLSTLKSLAKTNLIFIFVRERLENGDYSQVKFAQVKFAQVKFVDN